MSSSILEVLRFNHEQSERYEVAIGEELDQRPNGQKAKVHQQHRLNQLAHKVVECNQEIQNIEIDADGLLQDELNRMRSNPLDNFYASLNTTLEYYEKFPGLQAMEQPPMDVEVNVDFSGEEIFGKYLDLNPLFLQFCNVMKTGSIEQDYLQYLERFQLFFYIPQEVKNSKAYFDYLVELWNYLTGFYKRIHPLIDIDRVIGEWEKEFDGKVESGDIKLKGGNTTNQTNTGNKKEPQPLRLGMFNDPKELEALGMDRLKEALEALGLKCGGTLQDRAQRLWSIRGKKMEEIPANLKVKAKKADAAQDSQDVPQHNHSNKRSPYKVAQLEFLITSLCDVMGDIISATRRHAEKQQARSVEEKEQEIMEEEFGLLPDHDDKQDGDDDDEAPVYNPLNVPLGWDGKPIPLWLYKLHGLGVEYKCEVCGNYSYWGRKAFDRHFQEFRHATGMRCLGVPNTKHFHDITLIADVLALYHKIKDELRREQFNGDLEEEFEDSQGNVLNRRTYEDLARQGLL